MKIAYTYSGITSYKVGGVSRYFFEIISRLKSKHKISILCRYSKNIYFKELIDKKEFLQNINFRGKTKLEHLLQEFAVRKQLSKGNFELVHHTGEDPYLLPKKISVPVVITIHDFIPEIFHYQPDRIKLRALSIKNAAAVICVSENTKKDLFRFFPEIDSNKVYVVYHGFQPQPCSVSENKRGKYLLYVGARTTYKNFEFFVRALAPVLIERNLKLICTGQHFNQQELLLLRELKIHDFVACLGFVEDNILNELYRHAQCFVYPSLYEGFGIPILEAFGNQCPVCISNTSCFPEIAKDAASYFSPDSKNSMVDAILKIIDDSVFRQQLIQRGTKRLADFSWDRSAQQTSKIYEEIAERHQKS